MEIVKCYYFTSDTQLDAAPNQSGLWNDFLALQMWSRVQTGPLTSWNFIAIDDSPALLSHSVMIDLGPPNNQEGLNITFQSKHYNLNTAAADDVQSCWGCNYTSIHNNANRSAV